MRRFLSLGAGVAVAACVNLPEGWEDARRVPDFTQSDCDGSPYDTAQAEPELTATEGGDGALAVSAEPLTFRCAQDVEGFWKESGGLGELLVQPKDMHPSAVAGCDCLYRIDARVQTDGVDTVAVWRRWDDLNEPNDPIKVGEAAVDAP